MDFDDYYQSFEVDIFGESLRLFHEKAKEAGVSPADFLRYAVEEYCFKYVGGEGEPDICMSSFISFENLRRLQNAKRRESYRKKKLLRREKSCK